jgi:hypothetical protein
MTMRAVPRIWIAVLLAPLACAAFSDESLEELKNKAEASSGGDQAVLYARVAREEVELANQNFTDGNVAQGHAAVQEAVAYAAKAGEAARDSRKKMKKTEMSLRETARRLSDIGKTLALDDRPAVEQAVRKIHHVQDQILDAMFGGRKREP